MAQGHRSQTAILDHGKEAWQRVNGMPVLVME
jgi:hypothetical protein